MLLVGCADTGPQLTPHEYRLWISGEPDGFTVAEQFFSFKLEHDDEVSGWGCLDYQCFPNPRAGECAATALTENQHVELTDALNRAGALDRDDETPYIDTPSFRFKLEQDRVGGPGNEFELQRRIEAPGIGDALALTASVVETCPMP